MSPIFSEPRALSAKDDALADGLRRLQESGGGILDVYLVDTKCAARLSRDAMRGDAKAAQLLRGRR